MKVRMLALVVLLVGALVLGGCQAADTPPVVDEGPADLPVVETDVASGDAVPENWGRAVERELGKLNWLSLGTLRLEGGVNAVTAEQATVLLPLWQLLQSDSLQSAAETEAVLKQIEGMMTAAQIAEIDALGLTFEDLQAWMAEQGIEQPAVGEGQERGPSAMGDISEEDREKMREQFQSLQDMSPAERAAAREKMGFERPGGGAAGGPGGMGGRAGGTRGGNAMLDPLIELLTARAAE